jgi:aminoglycoside phosphotransferase (APT) family kinase protein
MIDYVDVSKAKQIIKELYPNAKNVEVIEHGYDNIVGLIDKEVAIKFPRYDHAHNRDKFEQIILEDLASLSNVAIPKVFGSNDNPPYLILSFIHGQVLSAEEINALSNEEQKEFAKNLAKFAFKMHSTISLEKTIIDQKNAGIDDFDFYKYALENFHFPKHEQDRIAKEVFKTWKNLKYGGPKVVNHNDLNVMNLLFSDKKLVGIIDFGDARIGHAEQELRQLYRISEFILEIAIEEYEKLAGHALNKEAIKINAIVQELAAYANRIKEPNHPGFIKAKQHLEQWFPECNWEAN